MGGEEACWLDASDLYRFRIYTSRRNLQTAVPYMCMMLACTHGLKATGGTAETETALPQQEGTKELLASPNAVHTYAPTGQRTVEC